ncbi:MAG TPA: serine/threonine-protein kinase, partial [Gemmatales bacterium]|nr:serine/threonine-protein kinase [Gemmatales bacterium]
MHRDLKPANVLLAGPTDGGWDQVEPKVTDFGLAAVADGLGGLTRSGQAVGTLSYMAPEQAAGGAEASAPAVDVYALGAVLYECLTGRPPVVGDSEQDLLRQVLEGEPIPAARLRPGLPRDLETIVMCCLAKQPRRRYASPLAVAEDLERFLRDEPIQARRATWKEQSWRWLRRRPAVATLLGAILVGAAALTTMAYVYTSQLRVALRDAQVQRELAATNAQEAQSALASESRRRQQARSALDALASQLVAHGRSVGRGSGDQVAMLEQALRAYEELAADVPGDPVARFGVADAWSQTARLLVALGRYAEAENAVSQAADHFRLLTEQAPGELSYRRRWISSHLDRATIRFRQKKGVEASQDIEQALKLQRALVAQFPQAEHRANLARVLVNAGSILLLTDGAAAAKAEQEAERLWEELVAEVPDDESFRFGLAQMLHNRAYRLFTEGALGGAESLMRRAQELRLTVAIEKLVLTTRMERAIGHDILAMILVAQKKPAEALAECRLAIDLLVDVVKERPNMADAYLKLSEVLLRASLQGNDLNLDAEYARCVPHLVRWLSVNDHPESAVRLGGFACNHANLVLARQQPIVALKAFDVAERALATVGEEDPRREMADKFTANTYVGRARALEMLKRFGEAVAAWDGAVRLERGPQRAIYQLERSRALVALGEIAQACAAAEAADRPEDADLFLRRAAVFALASQRASNEESLAACEAGARKWLERLQGAGRLGPNVVRYLKNHDEWEALRQRPDF